MTTERIFKPYHVSMNKGLYCVYKYTDERRIGASKIDSFTNYDDARFEANRLNAEYFKDKKQPDFINN